MPTKVRFRFNATTGEIEEFVVDDLDRSLPEAEHDRRARQVGRMIAADPRIVAIDHAPSAQQAAAAPAEPHAEQRTNADGDEETPQSDS